EHVLYTEPVQQLELLRAIRFLRDPIVLVVGREAAGAVDGLVLHGEDQLAATLVIGVVTTTLVVAFAAFGRSLGVVAVRFLLQPAEHAVGFLFALVAQR